MPQISPMSWLILSLVTVVMVGLKSSFSGLRVWEKSGLFRKEKYFNLKLW